MYPFLYLFQRVKIMKSVSPIVAISFILLTVVNISQAVFQNTQYDSPSLKLFSWVCFILFFICLTFISDTDSSDTDIDDSKGSHREDKDW